MSLELCLQLSCGLLGLSLLLQNLEMLAISKRVGTSSAWDWNHISGDISAWPSPLQTFLAWVYTEKFRELLLGAILISVLFVIRPVFSLSALLILSSLMLGLRFRGVFNGGSDYMTMTQLIGASIALARPNDASTIKVGLFYIAIQTTLSYFIAGVVKLRSPAWRSGFALNVFLNHSNYAVPNTLKRWSHHPALNQAFAWMVISWETTFPIIWLSSLTQGKGEAVGLTIAYLSVGFLFHLGNFVAFGINRFVFAWLASYPALFYCTQ